MAAYLEKVKTTFNDFEFYYVERIPRENNAMVDALARLATSKEAKELSIVPIEILHEPNIILSEEVELVQDKSTWMTPIIDYLLNGTLPEDKNEARRLMYQLPRYTMLDNKLYRRGFLMPLLKCVAEPETTSILKEIHEGFCEGHTWGNSLAQKITRQGYFRPTLKTDAQEYVKKCDKCQRFADIPRAPPVKLTTMTSPWSFAV